MSFFLFKLFCNANLPILLEGLGIELYFEVPMILTHTTISAHEVHFLKHKSTIAVKAGETTTNFN